MGSPISPFPGMHQSPISNPSLGSARLQAEPLPSLQSESESGSSVSPFSGMHQSPNPVPSLGSRPNQLAPVSSLQSNSEAGSDEEGTLLHVSFNQDSGCLACGTSQGFRVYSCDPFKETLRRNFSNGGIGIVEMLFRSNILALVGGGTSPQFPSNKVMIWDDHQSRCIGELSFRSEVRAVKLRRDRIVVVLEQKIYVYNFADLKLLNHIETLSNPKGLCVLSHAPDASVLACPGLHCGQVRVEHYGLKRSKFIPAHDSDIACLALTLDGLLLATAGTKGTLIRIFNTLDGTRLQEVRRGADRAEIYSIALSQNAQWLAVSSDKGTIHIFGVKVQVAGEQSNVDSMQGSPGTCNSQSGDSRIIPYAGSNPGSSFSFMKGVLPKYFSSEWSFAQFHLLEGTRYLVAFGQKNTIVIVGIDGSFYKCVFDPAHGGPMVEQEYTRFFKSDKATVN